MCHKRKPEERCSAPETFTYYDDFVWVNNCECEDVPAGNQGDALPYGVSSDLQGTLE